MAIKDLLWACPVCGRESALRPVARGEACEGCGTRFRRGDGAAIVAEALDGRSWTRTAVQWLQRLPDMPVAVFGDDRDQRDSAPPENAATVGGGESPIRSADVLVRFATGEVDVRRGRRFLGRVERFGPARPGVLVLYPDRITLREGQAPVHDWRLDRLTAIQPSSSVLQLKLRGEPLASLRFPRASVRFWEELLQEAVRRWYRRHATMEVIEFHPRIVTRPSAH